MALPGVDLPALRPQLQRHPQHLGGRRGGWCCRPRGRRPRRAGRRRRRARRPRPAGRPARRCRSARASRPSRRRAAPARGDGSTSRTSAPLARTAERSALTISAPVRSPACSSRGLLAPPQRRSRSSPSSRLNPTPSDSSQATAPGPRPSGESGRVAAAPPDDRRRRCPRSATRRSPLADRRLDAALCTAGVAGAQGRLRDHDHAGAGRAGSEDGHIPAPPDLTTSTGARVAGPRHPASLADRRRCFQ